MIWCWFSTSSNHHKPPSPPTTSASPSIDADGNSNTSQHCLIIYLPFSSPIDGLLSLLLILQAATSHQARMTAPHPGKHTTRLLSINSAQLLTTVTATAFLPASTHASTLDPPTPASNPREHNTSPVACSAPIQVISSCLSYGLSPSSTAIVDLATYRPKCLPRAARRSKTLSKAPNHPPSCHL